jgi:SOS response regulatory protein OraA/RecX
MSFSAKARAPREPRPRRGVSQPDGEQERRSSEQPRAPRRARPRISLKMQAIGFLSRREHSRQELRMKLLDSLRKRAREQAALAAAAQRAARALAEVSAQAIGEPPSNGIDDAFAPPAASPPPPGGVRASAPRRSASARTGEAATSQAGGSPSLDKPALETLSLASGAPIPAALRASLAAASASVVPSPARPASTGAALEFTRDTVFPDAAEDVADIDGVHLLADDTPSAISAPLAVTELELTDPEAAVDQLLDWLVANKYLSETRFIESRVNARARKQGTLLIKLELSRHGLSLEPEQAAELRETEFARAQALWQRKFGVVAPDARVRAKQARFLAARGFAAGVVRRVVGGEEDD